MNRPPDEDELARLLQALSGPEPSAAFAAGARRRYRAAIEARERRLVLIGLAAALVGLTIVVVLAGTMAEPVSLMAWLAEAMADLVRWTVGTGVILALVPLIVWAGAALGFAAAALSIALIARPPSPATVK